MLGELKRKHWLFIAVRGSGTAARPGNPSLCPSSSGRQQAFSTNGLTQPSHLYLVHESKGSDNIPDVLGLAVQNNPELWPHSFPGSWCWGLAALPIMETEGR